MYVDLHLHLVPGVDDGVRDLDAALALARILVDRGWHRAAVSPHIRPGRFDNTPAGLRTATQALSEALAAADIPLEVLPGAEHYLDGELPTRLTEGDFVPMGGQGRVALVEAPLSRAIRGLPEVVFRLRLKGVTPVFAHPERCESFEDLEVADRVVAGGGVLQLDLGSLAGAYGRTPRKRAEKLLRRGLYAVVGTDLHTPQQAEKSLDKWLKVLGKAVGPEGLERLMIHNPTRLLDGQPVHP